MIDQEYSRVLTYPHKQSRWARRIIKSLHLEFVFMIVGMYALIGSIFGYTFFVSNDSARAAQSNTVTSTLSSPLQKTSYHKGDLVRVSALVRNNDTKNIEKLSLALKTNNDIIQWNTINSGVSGDNQLKPNAGMTAVEIAKLNKGETIEVKFTGSIKSVPSAQNVPISGVLLYWDDSGQHTINMDPFAIRVE